jgi:hypothetical protein
VRRFGGVPEDKIDGLFWDEFIEELVAACRFEGLDR